MGLLEDMLKPLDRVEIWKQLQGTLQRISELEKRVAELEGKIGGKWPADVASIVEREQYGCIASSAPKGEKCANIGNAANAIESRRAWS
jgi:hypothetical protein